MILGLLELELHISDCGSLKGKRKVIKSIIHKIRNKYNVSIGEMGNQDLWQRALIGIACVSQTENDARKLLDKIEREIFDMYLVDKIHGRISIYAPEN